MPRVAQYLLSALTVFAVIASQPQAGDASEPQQDAAFFETRIRPVLVEHCYECHSGSSDPLQAGLRVDTREGLRSGGDSGPAVVPGDPDGGTLLEALRYESFEMPPDGRLPEHTIADFEAWIGAGAIDPREGEANPQPRSPSLDLEEGRRFWAFQPLDEAVLRDAAGGSAGAIDRLIQQRLSDAGLEPVERAERDVLCRRLFFDLIGLPPSERQLEQFVQDPRPDAYQRLVDRLLTSPEFGVRWGRHWLDIARYAESTGGGRSLLIPSAWRYRDWVFAAWNADKPLDRQIEEQLAGDLLPAEDYRQGREQMVATAFLALGPHNYENQDKLVLEMDIIDEQIDTVGRAMLGMTLGCARCHDHKFDPIPMRDYYALAGIFRSTRSVEHANVSKWVERPLPLTPEQQRAAAEHQASLQKIDQRRNALVKQRKTLTRQLEQYLVDDDHAELQGEWKTSTAVKNFVGTGYRYASQQGALARFAFDDLEPGRYEVLVSYTPHGNRAAKARFELHGLAERGGDGSAEPERVAEVEIDQRQKPSLDGRWEKLGQWHISHAALDVVLVATGTGAAIADAVRVVRVDGDAVESGSAAERLYAVERQIEAIEQQREKLLRQKPAEPPAQIAVGESESIADCPLYIRGDAHRPADPVPRGFLTVIDAQVRGVPADASGRLELARWIASPENPLTARVFANRVWEKLFGVGIVRSVDNFGFQGERPAHPELLDWLAARLIAGQWSTKKLVRDIVLSDAYTRDSRRTELQRAADPENRLLAAQNRRRLQAEPLRDAMLVLSGELDLRRPERLWPDDLKSELQYEFAAPVRSAYLPVWRNQLESFLAQFDFPDPNLSRGRRSVTTLPTQALSLMNSPWVLARSEAAAARLLEDSAFDDSARVEQLFLRAYGRRPRDSERALAARFLDSARAERLPERDAWAGLCHVVVASLDFRYIR